MSAGVELLVPIKGFDLAKLRLSGQLRDADRSRLARHLAAIVLDAAGDLPVNVVCDDAEVATWARDHGADVVRCPVRGLNAAVAWGYRSLSARGVDRVVISHADLPLAATYDAVAGGSAMLLVTDRHGDGTNVMSVPAGLDIDFRYGPGSRAAHLAMAADIGLAVEVVSVPELEWDVDTPDDLVLPDGTDLRTVALGVHR